MTQRTRTASRGFHPIALVAGVVAIAGSACGPERNPFMDTGAESAAADDGVLVDAIDVRDAGVLDAMDRMVPIDAPPDAIDALDAIDAPSDTRVSDVVDAVARDVPADVPPADAGPSARCTPVIDGTVGADWTADTVITSNSVASMWGSGLNELRSMRVCYDSANLYLGIAGTVEPANGIVVYLDRDFGASSGVSLFSGLTDRIGALDSRVSAALVFGSGAMGFAAEGAWGTTDMTASLAGDAGISPLAGLRLFTPTVMRDRRSDFDWIAGVTTVCRSAGACEVAIPWPLLFEGPPPATTTLAMFARLNNGDASMSSNQTLPQDDPSVPRTVNRLLVIGVRF